MHPVAASSYNNKHYSLANTGYAFLLIALSTAYIEHLQIRTK